MLRLKIHMKLTYLIVLVLLKACYVHPHVWVSWLQMLCLGPLLHNIPQLCKAGRRQQAHEIDVLHLSFAPPSSSPRVSVNRTMPVWAHIESCARVPD
jgi:hypothetical protein